MVGLDIRDDIGSMRGHWRLDIYRGDDHTRDNLLRTIEGENLVTTTGKGLLLDRLFGITATAITSMGVGNSATAAVVGDTQLAGSAPVPFLQALDTVPPSRASLVVTCISTFSTANANQTWQELALFNGTVNGTSVMLNRIAPIGPFTKTSAVSIVCTCTIQQA